MAKQTIGIGASANDGTGDTLRAAFDKCNDNFDELYSETLVGLTPTKGNIVVGNGTDWIAVGVGSNDQVLTADSAQASGVKWAAAAGGASSPLELTASSASEIPLTINGAASQTANPFQIEDSSGNVKFSISALVLAAQGMGFSSSASTNGWVFFQNTAYAVGKVGGEMLIAGNDSVSLCAGGSMPSPTKVLQVDKSTTAGDTRLLLWDVDAGALRRVSVGANDSGGTGFKVLRVAN